MKKFFLSILLFFIIIFSVSTFLKKNENLVNASVNEITSITIVEWKGRTITINDKNVINKFISYLNSLQINKGTWYIKRPDTWDFRIAIYGTVEHSLLMLKDSFYLTYDRKVYKRNFVYSLDEFDYDYILDYINNIKFT